MVTLPSLFRSPLVTVPGAVVSAGLVVVVGGVYIEVKWDGYNIANANKKYQLAVGFYYGDTWDPTNDWSYQGITKCKDTYQDGSETGSKDASYW